MKRCRMFIKVIAPRTPRLLLLLVAGAVINVEADGAICKASSSQPTRSLS